MSNKVPIPFSPLGNNNSNSSENSSPYPHSEIIGGVEMGNERNLNGSNFHGDQKYAIKSSFNIEKPNNKTSTFEQNNISRP